MFYKKYIVFLFICTLFLTGVYHTEIHAQGCSDAGACSIGSLEEFEEGDIFKPMLRLSFDQNVSLGEKFTFISSTSVIVDYQFLKHSSIVVRTPFIFTSGNLGNSSGVGDVLVSFIQQLFQNKDSQFGILIGGKLKTNNSDLQFGGSPLPMAYQTSLGTYDVIVGGQYLYKTWDFYLAYQHPFGKNENEYLQPQGETDENKLYFESAYLKRGDDVAVRVQKTFFLKKEQKLQPGIMPIFRLQKSEITKNDISNILDGSNGLTLNLYLTYSKKVKKNTMLYLTAAFPVIDRSYRADGLTRNFILSFRVTQLW